MRTTAQKQNEPQRPASSSLNLASARVESMLQGYSAESEPELIDTDSSRARLDFTQITIYPPAGGAAQTDPNDNNPAAQNKLSSKAPAFARLASRGESSVFPAGEPRHKPTRRQTTDSEPSGLGQGAVPPVVHEMISSPGQPLDATIRGFMEPRFGCDFGHVRVHSGPRAAASAGQVGAIAYTIGQHVVIGERGPSLESVAGQQLWAHELAHVVQQSRGGSAPALTHSAAHERDADAAAMSLGMGHLNILVACNTGIGLACAPKKTGGPTPPPRPYREVVRDIHGTEAVLQDLRQNALDILTEEGVNIEARGAIGPKIEHVKQWLAGIASDPGSPRRAAAKKTLEQIEAIQKELGELNQELRDIHAATSQGTTTHFESTETGVESAESKLESTSAKPEGAAVKSEGAAMKAEGAALKGERATAELGVSAAKEAGFAAKVGNVLEAGLPGPQDVLFLFVSFFGSLAEAKAKLGEEAYSEGFARGAAAKLLGMQPDWVPKHLIRKSFGGSIGEQIAGFEGVKEHGVSQGAVDGYVFARRFTQQQIVALRRYGYAAMLLFTGARIDPQDDVHNVNVLGNALKTKLEEMLEEAQEAARQQEAERLRAEYAEEIRKRGGWASFRGHGWAQP